MGWFRRVVLRDPRTDEDRQVFMSRRRWRHIATAPFTTEMAQLAQRYVRDGYPVARAYDMALAAMRDAAPAGVEFIRVLDFNSFMNGREKLVPERVERSTNA